MTPEWIDQWNVAWTSPSANSGESMPCGGHDIGLNVWVEGGDLLFYIDRDGSFDENHQQLKLGRVRVRLEPSPFGEGAPFLQTLRLRRGDVEIVAGESAVRIRVWVEMFRPVIHVDIEAPHAVRAEAFYESWRRAPLDVPQENRHATLSLRDCEEPVTTWPDVVGEWRGGVRFFHRNRDAELLRDRLIRLQGLEAVADEIPDTQRGRTFGGWMGGSGWAPAGTREGAYAGIPCTAWVMAAGAAERHRLTIVCHTAQTDTLEEWGEQLEGRVAEPHGDKADTEAWWEDFAGRSWIRIKPGTGDASDPAWQVGRNVHLFRHLLACNAFGTFPSKFNGSLFTYDPVYIGGPWMNSLAGRDLSSLTPDFRCWGGGSFTGQNQRLLYWPLLKSGDADLMPAQFDYYRRGLPGAEARTRDYWGHGGCCFTEQLENFGLPIGWSYGWSGADASHVRPPGLDRGVLGGKFIRYHYDSQVEFALMVLEYARFTGNPVDRWLPLVRSVLRFYDEHYRFRCRQATGAEFGPDGRYVFEPSTALETFKNARNPLTVITGLRVLIDAVLALPGIHFEDGERERYRTMRSRLPEIPLREVGGRTVFAPAERFDTPSINMEDPQLYGVFPYPVVQPENETWQVAQDTWDHDDLSTRFRPCWGQTAIWAARLGRTAEARALVEEKLSDAPRRFPVFWGPNPDWVPDLDHGGSGMIALQEMLLRTDGDLIHLLPAWPDDWDVDFRLHAPRNTVVEGSVRDGKLTALVVTPPSREGDVRVGPLPIHHSVNQ